MPVLPFTVGFELEINKVRRDDLSATTYDVVRTAFTAAGITVDTSTDHRARSRRWLFKHDGSCGFEIVSPILRTVESLAEIERVVDIFRQLNARVDERCGLHIHVGVGGLARAEILRVLAFFSRYERVFFLLSAPSRQINRYCMPITRAMRHNMRRRGCAAWQTKYYWLNGLAEADHGTIEFRVMESRLDASFITGWINLLEQIFDHVVNGNKLVQWGEASAKSNEMLVLTMLQQAGCYGRAMRNPERAKTVRRWVVNRFRVLQSARQ